MDCTVTDFPLFAHVPGAGTRGSAAGVFALVGVACNSQGGREDGDLPAWLRTVGDVPPDDRNLALFPVAVDEVSTTGPMWSTLLAAAWQALESAGHTPAQLSGSQTPTGVFVSDGVRAAGEHRDAAASRLAAHIGLAPMARHDDTDGHGIGALAAALSALEADVCELALVVSTARTAQDGIATDALIVRRIDAAQRDGDPILATLAVQETGDASINVITHPADPLQSLRDLVRIALARQAAQEAAIVSVAGATAGTAWVLRVTPADVRAATAPTEAPQVLRLSAASEPALDRAAENLAEHLDVADDASLADVAFTLAEGRATFAHRLCVVATDTAGAIRALRTPDSPARSARVHAGAPPAIIFTFPGQGAQYAAMGKALYDAEPVFREACDTVFASLYGITPFDLRDQLFSGSAEALTATAVTQPATFCLEFALACLWRARGVEPRAMIGHSVGEFVAAVLAGVMPLPDAARLVARRGALMNALPTGSMLSVRQSAAELHGRLPASLAIAADNAPNASVVSGTTDAIVAFARMLEAEGVLCRLLQTSHAFHSPMMDPILAAFGHEVARVPLTAPRVPIISTLTGAWLTPSEACDPAYWTRHLRDTVRFSPAVATALRDSPGSFLEVGPRQTLTTLVRQHAGITPDRSAPDAIASLPDGPLPEHASFLHAVGQLWVRGIDADRPASADRRRLRLPTYPFDRTRSDVVIAPQVPAPAPMPYSTTRRGALTPRGITAITTRQPTPAAVPRISARADGTPAGDGSVRRDALRARLRALFTELAGVALSAETDATPFVELGLDSLVLTQAAIQVRKTFGVSVSFRDLMERHRSLDALAGHLHAALPPETVAAPAPTAPPPAVSAPAGPAAGSFAEQVIQQQLAIMRQQLVLLGGTPVPAPAAAVAPALRESQAPSAATAVSTTAQGATGDDAAALAHTRYDVQKAFGAIARIHTSAADLDERQRQRLDAFVRSYTDRTKGSKAYTVAHRAHLADPRVVNGFRPQTKELCYQVVVERSKGCRLWDVDGNEYIDALNGFGMSLFGWQPTFVNDAVKAQLDAGVEIGPQHPLAGEVAQLVCELTGFDRAGLCNTGSEAVMGAVRIARTVTARNLIVTFSGSYHGIFDEVLVRGTRSGRAVPAAPGVLQAAVENVLVLEYGTAASLQVIRERAADIAAVLVEPVQSRRPDFQPIEFLRELRSITEAAGSLLIFDEVITGFRAHQRGAQGLFGITADLATYGKVVGGGYPIGVIAGRRDLMDALDGGGWQYGDASIPTVGVTYFAGTFVRHPLALAACKAALLHLREQGPTLQRSLTARTEAMVAEMNAFAQQVGAPVAVRSFASLWRIAFTEEHPLQDLLFAMMRHRGIHILDNFPCFLTTAHTGADVGQIVAAFRDAVTEMQSGGFLPGAPQAASAPSVIDAARPPVPDARLGRDPDGTPAWYVPDPAAPGQYVRLTI